MNERYESAYGEAMRKLAQREGHKAVLPQFLGGDAQRDLAAQRRAQSRDRILKALPGTVGEISRRTGMSENAIRNNLRALWLKGKITSFDHGSVTIWRRV